MIVVVVTHAMFVNDTKCPPAGDLPFSALFDCHDLLEMVTMMI